MDTSKIMSWLLFIVGLIFGASMNDAGQAESPTSGKAILGANICFLLVFLFIVYVCHGVYVVLNMPSVGAHFLPVAILEMNNG